MPNKERSGHKRLPKIAFAIILSGLFLWIMREVWYTWGELRGVASTPETIVFQTGGVFSAGKIALLLLGFLLVAGSLAIGVFALPSEIKKCWHRTRSLAKATKEAAGMLVLMLVLLFGGFMLTWLNAYETPCWECIVINKSSQVISIEKHYLLLRSDEHLRILFDEVDHITYQYHAGVVTGQPSALVSPSGSVEITKLDGMSLEVSSNGPNEQRDLARAIAGATGKELIMQR